MSMWFLSVYVFSHLNVLKQYSSLIQKDKEQIGFQPYKLVRKWQKMELNKV